MSLTITPDVPFTLTVPIPQPNFYDPASAQLSISTAKGQSVRSLTPSSVGNASLTFSGTVSKSQARGLYQCAQCQGVEGRYSVILREGSIPLDPPIKTIATGSVSLSGPPPCGECGGSDPDQDPPPEGDNAFGRVGPGDDLVPLPRPPSSVCLPPSFVAPPPGVPTPCS